MASQLPNASSQAKVFSPIAQQPKADFGREVARQLPQLANAFARAWQVGEKQEAAEQKAAMIQGDQELLKSATLARNAVQDQRFQAVQEEQNLQALAVDVMNARSDGQISREDEALELKFANDLQKIKTARQQGALGEAGYQTQIRMLRESFISNAPARLAPDLEKIFQVGTGSSVSANTGSATQAGLRFNQRMESIYGPSYTKEDVLVETNKQQQLMKAQEYDTMSKLGQMDFGKINSQVNIMVNDSISTVTTQAAKVYQKQQALTADQIDAFSATIDTERRRAVTQLHKSVQDARANGKVISPDSVRASEDRINKNYDTLVTSLTDKDLQKQLVAREKLIKTAWMNGLGGQMARLNQMSPSLGDGGIALLTGMLQTDDPTKLAVLEQYAADAGIPLESLENPKQIILEALARSTEDVTPPGYERLDAFLGLGAAKQGKIGDVMKKSLLDQLTTLSADPEDAPGVIDSLNDPRIGMQYQESPDWIKNKTANTVNSRAAMVMNDIEDRGYSVEYDDRNDQFIVYREDAANRDVIGPAGSILGDRKLPGKRVNKSLSRDLDKIYSIYRNGYYSGILKSGQDFVKDIEVKFQSEQPVSTED